MEIVEFLRRILLTQKVVTADQNKPGSNLIIRDQSAPRLKKLAKILIGA